MLNQLSSDVKEAFNGLSIELKEHRINATYPLSTSGSLTYLPIHVFGVSQGMTNETRVGNRIKPVCLTINFVVTFFSDELINLIMRFMAILSFNHSNAPDYSSYPTPAGLSPIRVSPSNVFEVLYDKSFKIVRDNPLLKSYAIPYNMLGTLTPDEIHITYPTLDVVLAMEAPAGAGTVTGTIGTLTDLHMDQGHFNAVLTATPDLENITPLTSKNNISDMKEFSMEFYFPEEMVIDYNGTGNTLEDIQSPNLAIGYVLAPYFGLDGLTTQLTYWGELLFIDV